MTQDPNKLQLVECIVHLSMRARELNLPELGIVLEHVANLSIQDEEDELRIYTDAFLMHKMVKAVKKNKGVFLIDPDNLNDDKTK